jgi:hypothetical protein
MKDKNFEISFDILAMFALSNEEMICVRGGGDPTPTPPPPPFKI